MFSNLLKFRDQDSKYLFSLKLQNYIFFLPAFIDFFLKKIENPYNITLCQEKKYELKLKSICDFSITKAHNPQARKKYLTNEE